MLLEVLHARQIPNDYFRRIFADKNMDLVIWYRPDDSIYGFQLSYDPVHRPRALTWTADRGFSHDRIDDGEGSPLANRSATLEPDDDFDAAKLASDYRVSAQDLPDPIRDFIGGKIEEFIREES
jgi:hypothetical protein